MKKIKVFHSPERIKEIKAEIEDLERMMSADDEKKRSDIGYFRHSSSAIQTPEDVQREIDQKKKRLASGTPTKLTGPEANKAYAYAKKLKQYITENMPREGFVRYPKTDEKDRPIDTAQKEHDFERSVTEAMAWQNKRVNLKGFRPVHPVDLYHHIMRRLDPDAPREDFNRLTKEKV